MPTLEIPEATYNRLARRAAALSTSVEALAVPALEDVARGPEAAATPAELPLDEWQSRFDEWQAGVRKRADRYPPGFRADVSRESIYEGCGE